MRLVPSANAIVTFTRKMSSEAVPDGAVAQHEVLADLDGHQVLRRQVGHHVHVLVPAERVIDVEIARLRVENRGRGALVLVGPAADLDHPLMNVTASSGCFFVKTSLQVMWRECRRPGDASPGTSTGSRSP